MAIIARPYSPSQSSGTLGTVLTGAGQGGGGAGYGLGSWDNYRIRFIDCWTVLEGQYYNHDAGWAMLEITWNCGDNGQDPMEYLPAGIEVWTLIKIPTIPVVPPHDPNFFITLTEGLRLRDQERERYVSSGVRFPFIVQEQASSGEAGVVDIAFEDGQTLTDENGVAFQFNTSWINHLSVRNYSLTYASCRPDGGILCPGLWGREFNFGIPEDAIPIRAIATVGRSQLGSGVTAEQGELYSCGYQYYPEGYTRVWEDSDTDQWPAVFSGDGKTCVICYVDYYLVALRQNNSGEWVQYGINIEEPGGGGGNFGASVAISHDGDYIVVGNPYDEKAYYYEEDKIQNLFVLGQELTPPASRYMWGAYVAISPTSKHLIAVGCPENDRSIDIYAWQQDPSAQYVYETTLSPVSVNPQDIFGVGLAMSDDRVVTRSFDSNDNCVLAVYTRSAGWSKRETHLSSGGNTGNSAYYVPAYYESGTPSVDDAYYTTPVSMDDSGDHIAVLAPDNDDGTGEEVRIYSWDSYTGTYKQVFNAPGGWTVSIDAAGKTVLFSWFDGQDQLSVVSNKGNDVWEVTATFKSDNTPNSYVAARDIYPGGEKIVALQYIGANWDFVILDAVNESEEWVCKTLVAPETYAYDGYVNKEGEFTFDLSTFTAAEVNSNQLGFIYSATPVADGEILRAQYMTMEILYAYDQSSTNFGTVPVLGTGYRGVTVIGPRRVIVGTSGTILTSDDSGVTWTPRFSGVASDLNAVLWTGSFYMATGNGGIVLCSPDGITWSAAPGVTPQHRYAIEIGEWAFNPQGVDDLSETLFIAGTTDVVLEGTSCADLEILGAPRDSSVIITPGG